MESPQRVFIRCTVALGGLVLLILPAAARANFVTFESGPVRPLALSPDHSQLFAVNTPDDRLELYTIGAGGTLTHNGSVPVGLEPVAVAARTNTEVWVVNHLSDSVSIVDLSSSPPRVVRTLLVGDEPRDLVFAGPGGGRAFITTAHRGQNTALQATIGTVLTTPGIGRADVWVFDSANLGATLEGTPLTVVTLFGDTPRALAVSPDGNTVYAAVFQSGNRTTTVNEGVVCNGGAAAPPCTVFGSPMPGGLPAPNANIPEGITGPETGLVVQFNAGANQWQDRLGRNWTNAVRFALPDLDVFALNAAATPPVQTASFAGVGTVLFNMATNPVTGKVYVTNTDAHNEVRFEGPGGGGSTVRGHLHEARITVLDGAMVLPRHLNKHLNYALPVPPGAQAKSLALPTGLAVSGDGATLYVAAFGTSAVGVFSTAEVEADSFVPDAADHIAVSGGGPSGLVLDEGRQRLYVATRFDNGVSVIDTSQAKEIAHQRYYNPEPPAVVAGRPLLYDAVTTSSNGEAACGSCHIFGDFDSLAWDLGNPDDTVLPELNPFRVGDPIGMSFPNHHPLKGPMTTQSLRGMDNAGPMHWRGDRSGANDTPMGSALDEAADFKRFNVAFAGLLGRAGPLTDVQMQAFTDFILQVTYPPNPIRKLDNSFTPDQQAGRGIYARASVVGERNCNSCHDLDPGAGYFGTRGDMAFLFETQLFKIPHLRNAYQKVGMFGMPRVPFIKPGNNGDTGPQVRGFGFLHDGSVDTILRFQNAIGFTLNPAEAAAVEQFVLAFDTNLAPIVGQQITLTSTNSAVVGPRIDLLIARAAAGECDLVVKGALNGEARGWSLTGKGFRSDRSSEPLQSDGQLRAHARIPRQELTYTCVPPGSGVRIGIDRDQDGHFDRDELDAHSDPADPTSVPHSDRPARGERGAF
jgi:DNA-binding beta-propeller fold protein YncE